MCLNHNHSYCSRRIECMCLCISVFWVCVISCACEHMHVHANTCILRTHASCEHMHVHANTCILCMRTHACDMLHYLNLLYVCTCMLLHANICSTSFHWKVWAFVEWKHACVCNACVCMYVCMYVCIHVCVYVCMYTNMHEHTHTHMCIRQVHTYVVSKPEITCTHMYRGDSEQVPQPNARGYLQQQVCIMCMCMCTCTCTCTCTCNVCNNLCVVCICDV
jgi:hypothetical protein